MNQTQTSFEKCKYDNSPLELREVKRSSQQLLKKYYFTKYYFCPTCKRMYFSDAFKVENKNFDLFSKDEIAQFDVQIWTDGASSHNGKENAKAAWAFVAGKHEDAGLIDGKQTNNRAEAFAVYHALKWAGKKGYKKIKIHTDSQITIFGVLKSHEKVKENRDIFALIAEEVKRNNLDVKYEKVLGHSGDKNNERADRLAVSLTSK